MRYILIFVVILVLAYVGYKTAEEQGWLDGILPPAEEETEAVTVDEDEAVEDEAPPAVLPPSFDIVRVSRAGYATLAGRGAPEASVEVLANGETIATVPVTLGGEWVAALDEPIEVGAPVEFSLRMTTKDGLVLVSEQTVVISVPQDGEKPLILRTTPGGATVVLQRPEDPDVSVGPLSLETIDYDASGSVIFAGRAEATRRVQVFADGRLIASARADANGRWSANASLAPGVYTLQIFQLGPDGKPEYAIELPFKRETDENIALSDGKLVVQPGNNLWTISRRVYGEGRQYTVIYEANADQIRDPDLIYPGQIFVVPEEEESEG